MRLIDADAMKESIQSTDTDEKKVLSTKELHMVLVEWIDKRPTIEERKTGKWTKEIKHHKDHFQEFDYYEIQCSVCGGRPEKSWHLTPFCPNCGARMEDEP